MRLTILLIYLLLLNFNLFAQVPEDIQQELSNATSDTMRVRILLKHSDVAEDVSIMTYAQQALDIVNKNLPQANQDSKRVYLNYKAFALNNIGYGHRTFTGDNEKAIKYFTHAFEIYMQTGEKTGLTDCLANLQEVYLATGDLPKAKFFINKALNIQIASKDSDGIAATYVNLANLLNMQGQSDSALYYFRQALKLREAMNDSKNSAYILENMGTVYMKKGDLQSALRYFYKCFNYCDKYLPKSESSISLMHIGNVYSELEEYNRSLDFYIRAINILNASKNKAYMPAVLKNIGFVYSKLTKTDSAFYYYNEALKIATELDSKTDLSIIYVEMGAFFLKQLDTTKALNFYQNALNINEQLSADDRIADVCSRLGNLYFAQGNTDSAWYYGTKSLKLLEETNVARYALNVYLLMYKLNMQKGKYQEALQQYTKYISIRDSLNNNTNYRIALAHDFEFEKEKQQIIVKAEQQKKQVQIENQKKIIWISSTAFAIIIALGVFLFRINQKRRLNEFQKNIAEQQMTALRAQMNPHFIFNSLNAIQQMVLSNDNDNAFRYLDTYSKLTRKILENSDKQWITVDEEIAFLELYLSIETLRFSDAFSYKIKATENVSRHYNKLPPMIIQPYVENAVKHGLLNKKDNPHIKIDFELSNHKQMLIVSIEDNGIGRSNAAAQKDNTTHISKGMMITEQRIQLHNSSGIDNVTVEDLNDELGNASGTRIKISIEQPA